MKHYEHDNTIIMSTANIAQLKILLTSIYEEGGIKALKDAKIYTEQFKSRCTKLEKSGDILLSEFIEHGDINIDVILKKLSENTRKNHKCVIKSLKSYFVDKRKALVAERKALVAERKNNKVYDKIGKVAKKNHKCVIKSLKSYFVKKRKAVDTASAVLLSAVSKALLEADLA